MNAKRPGVNHSAPAPAVRCSGWLERQAFIRSTRSRPRDSSAPGPTDLVGPDESDVMVQQSVGKWSKTQAKTMDQRPSSRQPESWASAKTGSWPEVIVGRWLDRRHQTTNTAAAWVGEKEPKRLKADSALGLPFRFFFRFRGPAFDDPGFAARGAAIFSRKPGPSGNRHHPDKA